ncbi:MAG: DUF4878 domain-containing protein [Bacteroidota bacterium]|nr:DUF4878 domain-containing protein [Bacteroidota bacterium]
MKKIVLPAFTAVIILFTLFTGCKSAGGDPKIILSDFFDALAKKDFATAKKYTTKDSEGMLGMMQMGMQKMPDSSAVIQYKKDNIEMGNAVINGDVATVPVKDKKSGESVDFTLKNEDGWKVAIDFSTLMQMAQKKMKEHGMGNLQNVMNDSLKMMNGSMPNIDSLTTERMKEARKMMDSANKMLDTPAK